MEWKMEIWVYEGYDMHDGAEFRFGRQITISIEPNI